MKKLIKGIVVLLAVAMCLSLAVTVFAQTPDGSLRSGSNKYFGFTLKATGTTMNRGTNSSLKSNVSEPATIIVNSTNAPGAGYRLQLGTYGGTMKTYYRWYTIPTVDYPPYQSTPTSGAYYYMWARIDNDYDNGNYYSISGYFNSDEI